MTRKVLVSPSADLDEIAEATEGYSGADLQALVYNAHLEVIHSSLAVPAALGQSLSRDDETPLKYTSFGGSRGKTSKTQAEETAFQRRVGYRGSPRQSVFD